MRVIYSTAEPRVSESSQSDDDLPSIGDDPFQPRSIKFPKRSFGEKSFNSSLLNIF